MDNGNPELVRLWRGDGVESRHRGAWAVVDVDGKVVDHHGDPDQIMYARSSAKSLQALGWVETGLDEALGFGPAELAVACSSHAGHADHITVVTGMLDAVGVDSSALQCGPRAGFSDPITHECSGKHAGFLALSRDRDGDVGHYLDVDGPGQRHVRSVVEEMTGAELPLGLLDGCSAPTFRLPLRSLGRGLARLTSPSSLTKPARAAASRRLVDAVAARPEMIAGTGRICTEIARASAGRLFPKVGAEGCYVVGRVDAGQALVVTVDDGAERAVHTVVTQLLDDLGWLDVGAHRALADWADRARSNAAGHTIGRLEIVGRPDSRSRSLS